MSAFRASRQHLGVTAHTIPPALPLDVLDRWVAGTPTDEDRARVAAYADAYPGARQMLHALGEGEIATPANLDVMRQSVLRAVQANGSAQQTAPAKHSPMTRTRFGLIAGALAGVAAIGVYAVRPSTPSLLPARTYATQSGQRATVELPDGSRITLAPRTTLTLVNDTHGHPYTATLVGEADFNIVPNRAAAFAVRTGAVVTRVLGTTFEVRRYADEAVGQVIVLSGKVSVQGRGPARTLAANMLGHFSDSSVTTTIVSDPTQYTDWTHGSLVFRDTPVPVVLATLKRWYGYEFRLRDSTLASDVVTTVFPLGETQEMMQRLRRLLGVTMTFEDSVITLRPNQDNAPARQSKQDKNTSPLHTLKEVGR